MLGGTDILKQMAIERGYKPGGEEWWDTSEGMRFLAREEDEPRLRQGDGQEDGGDR